MRNTEIDYDAKEFFETRFRKYGKHSLKGVGNSGFSELRNYIQYRKARRIFFKMVKDLNLKEDAKILEIGYGSGFYTKVINSLGFKNYMGVDIVDVFKESLESEFPQYKFMQMDTCAKKIDFKECDLIFMIDVTQHMVNDKRFAFCLKNNVLKNLSKNGFFIATDELEDKVYSFYEVSRTIEFYEKALGMKLIYKPIKFRDKFIFSFGQIAYLQDKL